MFNFNFYYFINVQFINVQFIFDEENLLLFKASNLKITRKISVFKYLGSQSKCRFFAEQPNRNRAFSETTVQII